MQHSASELRQSGDILGPDSVPRSTGVRVGVSDLSGRRLEQAQLVASETTHMLLFRTNDAMVLDTTCYVAVNGVTYVVDYLLDPRVPRPGMWTECYAHVEKGDSASVSITYSVDGGSF